MPLNCVAYSCYNDNQKENKPVFSGFQTMAQSCDKNESMTEEKKR